MCLYNVKDCYALSAACYSPCLSLCTGGWSFNIPGWEGKCCCFCVLLLWCFYPPPNLFWFTVNTFFWLSTLPVTLLLLPHGQNITFHLLSVKLTVCHWSRLHLWNSWFQLWSCLVYVQVSSQYHAFSNSETYSAFQLLNSLNYKCESFIMYWC